MYKKVLSFVIAIVFTFTFVFSTTAIARGTSRLTATKRKATTVKKKASAKTNSKTVKKVVTKAKTKSAPKKVTTKVKPKATTKPKPKTTTSTIPAQVLTPEQQKRQEGYLKKNTLGIEYKRDAALWAKYDDNIDTYGLDEDPDENSPLFDARYVGFLSNELLKEYDDAQKITDADQKKAKINDIFSKEKMIYSIVVYKKAPTEDEIKKDVQCDNIVKIGEADGYLFYFGYNNYSDSDLSDEAKQAFKALYDDATVIKDTMTVFKPVSSEEGIMNLKKLEFNLKDLNGNSVTQDIFKQNDLTMINIWGTYCGPCIREMPTLQQLSTEMKDKKVGIVGVVSDVYTSSGVDNSLLDKAKQLVATAGVTYTNIIPDDTMKYDGLLSYVSAIPTSLFVDSNGNIVGEVRIGDGSKDEYTALIDKVLSKIKRDEGYVKKNAMGIEYKRDAALWAKYDDNILYDGPDSDTEDTSYAIYDGSYDSYLSNDLIKQYEAASEIKDKTERNAKIAQIFAQGKNLYTLVIYRKDKLPSEDQIKKDVKCQNQIKLGEVDGYIYYFGYDNYDDSGLPDAEKQIYKALYDDSMVMKDTIKIFKPISTSDGIKSLKKLSFNLKDINGNNVTESIFKQNKLTMVNIWGTYCGPCINELPILQQLSTEMKDKKVGVVGIVSDVYTSTGVDNSLVDKAKQLVTKAGVTYTNIIPDESMKYDGVLSYLVGIPTTFFVDSDGNIVGEVRIGDGTKDDYIKLIDNILSQMK